MIPMTPAPAHDLLYTLIETPSPTGAEQPIQRLIHERFQRIAHHLEPDVLGNLTLSLNPQGKPKILLSAHCDQIGYLVKHITPAGFIYLESLGGTDSGVILGERLLIHTRSGPVEGVVGRKPVHLQVGGEVQQIPTKDKIWVDLGCSSGDEARQLVAIGDHATFVPRITHLKNRLLAAPNLDNKAGLYVCLEVFRRCAAAGCRATLHVLSSTQEEIGSRGATSATNRIRPEVAIAVDTAPASDDPANDKPPQQHIPCALRAGPSLSFGPNTNPMARKLLVDSAVRQSIPHQLDLSGSTMPNDARAMQIADSGVATATVGIPQRNMHTQAEVVSLDDLEHAVRLLVGFVQAVDETTDFRPFYFRG